MIHRHARFAATAAGLALAAATLAADSGQGEIKGEYRLGSATLVDPSPDEKTDRVLLYFDGPAARDLYAAMPAAAQPGACDEALLTKVAGGLSCSRDPDRGEYHCSLGVLLADGSTAPAETC